MENHIQPFTFSGRVRSVRFALAGIWEMLVTQHNAWVHAAATLVVIAAGIFFGVTPNEWCLLVLSIIAVWVGEALNTAFEFLCDVASPEFHPIVKKSKDVAAAAVLLAAIGAVVVGLIVFLPYLRRYR